MGATVRRVLVTGATGYIGGRIVPLLLERGYVVRCLAREPRKLKGREWTDRVEIAEGDVSDGPAVARALSGCWAAYYFVHGMTTGQGDFAERDRECARVFAEQAGLAGVERIVYLGGLGNREGALSRHLASRQEVGDLLRSGSALVTELRAAMIIGSGSASFEILRGLVTRLPIMICPVWLNTKTQPIAVRDVLAYLVGCLDVPETAGRIFDVGGPDILSYRQMLEKFAAILGKHRVLLSVPFFSPRISALWIHLVTPIPASLARPLIEGLGNETICENDSIHDYIPIVRTGFEQAVYWALDKIRAHKVETRWTEAGPMSPHAPLDRVRSAALADRIALTSRMEVSEATRRAYPLRDEQWVSARVSPKLVFDQVRRIGGETGWFYANWLWRVRGFLDRMIGGVGLRRGRRDPVEIRIGDAIDFWRVADFQDGVRLLLQAEMRVPGVAWLEFCVLPRPDGGSDLIQTAYFHPVRFWGTLYWNLLIPMHWFVFRNMAAGLVAAAEHGVERQSAAPC